nr:MAG TPA: hypothetical protein [Caudoviricetes sp.]
MLEETRAIPPAATSRSFPCLSLKTASMFPSRTPFPTRGPGKTRKRRRT